MNFTGKYFDLQVILWPIKSELWLALWLAKLISSANSAVTADDRSESVRQTRSCYYTTLQPYCRPEASSSNHFFFPLGTYAWLSFYWQESYPYLWEVSQRIDVSKPMVSHTWQHVSKYEIYTANDVPRVYYFSLVCMYFYYLPVLSKSGASNNRMHVVSIHHATSVVLPRCVAVSGDVISADYV